MKYGTLTKYHRGCLSKSNVIGAIDTDRGYRMSRYMPHVVQATLLEGQAGCVALKVRLLGRVLHRT